MCLRSYRLEVAAADFIQSAGEVEEQGIAPGKGGVQGDEPTWSKAADQVCKLVGEGWLQADQQAVDHPRGIAKTWNGGQGKVKAPAGSQRELVCEGLAGASGLGSVDRPRQRLLKLVSGGARWDLPGLESTSIQPEGAEAALMAAAGSQVRLGWGLAT